MKLTTFLLSVLCLAINTSMAFAQDLTYWQDIRPLFRKHCTVCHSQKYLKKPDVSGGLALDLFDSVKKGSHRTVLTPGQSAKSLLVEYLVTTDVAKRMPLDSDPLPKEAIDKIRRWIDTGAKEGVAPKGDGETSTVVKSAATRKLDVVLPLALTAPAGAFGKSPAGKLEIELKAGPLAPIAALAYHPNGKQLAVGSYGQVVVWDLEKAQPLKVLTNVLGAVHDVKYSPDGKILAVGGGQPSGKGDLRLFQVGDWKLLAALRGHDDVVFSISFSKDGKTLMSGSFDHHCKVWDVEKHVAVKSLSSHSDFVYAVGISPNGKFWASASKDRTVQWIDAATAKSAFTFSGMEQDVMALAIHPDGGKLVSSGFEPGIYWWNTQTGEKIKTQGGHGTAVHELVFSGDGKRLVSAGADRTVRTWDGTTGAPLKSIAVGSSTYAVAISPSGKQLASGSFDGLVRLWDEATGRHQATLLAVAGENEQFEWLAVVPEGYANGSDGFRKLARWRITKAELAQEDVWTSLRQPAEIARALRGEAVAAPKIGKK